LAHRIGTLLAQGKVVFTATTVIGVTFQIGFALFVGLQKLGVRSNHRTRFGAQNKAVIVKKDHMGNANGALASAGLAGRHGRHTGLSATLTRPNALDGDALT
jgi:hypothetical protein